MDAMRRPWISPEDVREYSSLEDVKGRSDLQLGIDIRRAESCIHTFTNNSFPAEKYAGGLPEDVRVADIILSEYFAHNSAANGAAKKSESFDEYTYTTEGSFIEIKSLGIDALLEPYMIAKASGKAVVRLRKL